MRTILAVMLLCSGCMYARYTIEYPDKTKVSVAVCGFAKEPSVKNATMSVGTNIVFKVEEYSSRQDAVKEIVKDAIKEAAQKL